MAQTGFEPAYSTYAFNDGLGGRGDTGPFLKTSFFEADACQARDLLSLRLNLHKAVRTNQGEGARPGTIEYVFVCPLAPHIICGGTQKTSEI